MAAANASLGDLRTWTHHVLRARTTRRTPQLNPRFELRPSRNNIHDTFPRGPRRMQRTCAICCTFSVLQVLSFFSVKWNMWLTQRLQPGGPYLLFMAGNVVERIQIPATSDNVLRTRSSFNIARRLHSVNSADYLEFRELKKITILSDAYIQNLYVPPLR